MADAGRAPNTKDFNPVFATRLEDFRAALAKAGIESSISSGYRTPEYQNQMYQNHLAKKAHQPLPYPKVEAPSVVAAPWRSFHNYGLATDLILKNPNDYARMAEMAGQFGLAGIGPSDPGHIQLAGSLGSNIAQYELAGWRPDSSPAPTSGAIAYDGPDGGVQVASAGSTPIGTTINAASAPVAGALANQGPESVGSNVLSPLDLVAHFESGDRNIPQEIKDRNSAAGTPAQGHFQIIDPTWARYAGAAGVDLKKYPSAISAPREVQAQVASVIPVREWGDNTKKELLAAYPWIDVNKPLGDAQTAALKKVGGGTAVASAPLAAAPPAAEQPWWSKYTDAPTDKEGKPIEGAKSPVEKAIDAFTGKSSNMQARMEAQAPAGAGGFGQGPGARNVSPGLQNIAQTYGQTINSLMQPLTWNNAAPRVGGMAPAGSQAWAAPVPGLSLNSVQAPPEGLGYGIASNYGLG